MNSDREIMVSHHAVLAYRSRRGGDSRPFMTVHDEIAECVAEGIRAGRIFTHRPEGFVLYGRSSRGLGDPKFRFVQCSDDYGFILDPRDGYDIVKTMITRAGVNR